MENRVRHDNYPGDHPEPHFDLHQRSPLIHPLRKGLKLFRICKPSNDPLFFGRTGDNRFDSPDQGFGVLYLGMDEHCSFIETFGQSTGIAAVTEAELETRHLAEVAILRPPLIDLATSGGLARLGADARLLSGSHAVAQRWADALQAPPANPMEFSIRHDTIPRGMPVLSLIVWQIPSVSHSEGRSWSLATETCSVVSSIRITLH